MDEIEYVRHVIGVTFNYECYAIKYKTGLYRSIYNPAELPETARKYIETAANVVGRDHPYGWEIVYSND